jgi:hypothetical protein
MQKEEELLVAIHANRWNSTRRVANIVPNGTCTCGASEETPGNVFWQCQRFTKQRKNLTKRLLERWNTLPLKMGKIPIDMDPSDVNKLGAFINAAKIRM